MIIYNGIYVRQMLLNYKDIYVKQIIFNNNEAICRTIQLSTVDRDYAELIYQ